MHRTTISVITVSFNAREALRQCLEAVRAAAEGPSIDVIVVDNASTDGSADMVEGQYPDIKLIRNPRNDGFARACNQGIRLASGRFILLLNSDVVILPDALSKMIEMMGRYNTCGIAGCQLRNVDGTIQPSVRDLPSMRGEFAGAFLLDRLFPSSRVFASYRKPDLNIQTVVEVEQVSGAFLMIRREALDDIGPLDERFFMYYEDVDWCYQVKQFGWTVMYTPECSALHFGGMSANQDISFPYVESARSKVLYFRKHHGLFSMLLVQLLVMIEIQARMLVWLACRVDEAARHKLGSGKGWSPAVAGRILRATWSPLRGSSVTEATRL